MIGPFLCKKTETWESWSSLEGERQRKDWRARLLPLSPLLKWDSSTVHSKRPPGKQMSLAAHSTELPLGCFCKHRGEPFPPAWVLLLFTLLVCTLMVCIQFYVFFFSLFRRKQKTNQGAETTGTNLILSYLSLVAQPPTFASPLSTGKWGGTVISVVTLLSWAQTV